jgi:hypothetical protein
MASNAQQGKTPDWTEQLSLAGALAPILSRTRIAGPLGGLAQLPYFYKHWPEILAGLNKSDVMPFGVATLAEENERAFPDMQGLVDSGKIKGGAGSFFPPYR